jgi:hypothetical protein
MAKFKFELGAEVQDTLAMNCAKVSRRNGSIWTRVKSRRLIPSVRRWTALRAARCRRHVKRADGGSQLRRVSRCRRLYTTGEDYTTMH